MAKKVGTIAGVERQLGVFKAAAQKKPDLEVLKARQLGEVVGLLTLNDNLSRVFKQLQGNGHKHFLAEKDKGSRDYIDETKDTQIKKYVQTRFQSYMDDPDTSERARELFDTAYPPESGAVDSEEAAA